MIAAIKLEKVHALNSAYAMELHAAGKMQGDTLYVPLKAAIEIKRRHRTEKPKLKGFGDLVHKVALPIAKALKLSCVDPQTNQLRPDSPCAKRRAALNQAMPFKKENK